MQVVWEKKYWNVLPVFFLISALVMVVAAYAAGGGGGGGSPGEPHQFEGNVTINGEPALYIFIQVKIEGVHIDTVIARNGVYGNQPYNNLTITDPYSNRSGKIIEFFVDDIKAAEAVFENAGYTFLNLSINGNLNKCGDNICSGYDSCSSCAYDCGVCIGNNISITVNSPENKSILAYNYAWFNLTTAEDAVCRFTLENCTNSVVVTSSRTLYEGESSTYMLNNRNYTVAVDFVGSTTAKLTINGLLTPSLRESDIYYFSNDSFINLTDIAVQDFGGGVRHVTFLLGVNVVSCTNTGYPSYYPKSRMTTTGNLTHSSLLTLMDTVNYEWKHLTAECSGVSRNSRNVSVDFYVDTTWPLINITYPINGSNLTNNSFWLNATTNENAACSFYGAGCPANEQQPIECDELVLKNMSEINETYHYQHVSGLFSQYSYNLSVKCEDSAGNSNNASISFYVDAEPPVFSNIRTLFVTDNSATVMWETIRESNSTLGYNTTDEAAYDTVINDSTYQTKHKITLTGLQQDTDYHYQIKAWDSLGNENVSADYSFRTSVAEHVRQTIIANKTTTIKSSFTNTTLNIFANESVNNVSINITSGKESPTNKSLSVSKLKYLNIDVDAALSQVLSSVLLQIYYTDDELSEQNLSESSLGIYRYNSTSEEWIILNSSLNWVYGAGVDEANNFVWANVSHFSSYGTGGLVRNGFACTSNNQCVSNFCSSGVCSSPSSSSSSSFSGSSNTGGSSGGGGGGFFKAVNATLNESVQKESVPKENSIEGILEPEITPKESETSFESPDLITGRIVTDVGVYEKIPRRFIAVLFVLVLGLILRWRNVRFGPLYLSWYLKKLRIYRKQ